MYFDVWIWHASQVDLKKENVSCMVHRVCEEFYIALIFHKDLVLKVVSYEWFSDDKKYLKTEKFIKTLS